MKWLRETMLPNPSSPYDVTILYAVGIIIGVFAYRAWSYNTRTNEPPAVLSKVPLVGHVLSLLWNFDGFYTDIYKSNPSCPAVTLPLPGGAKQYMLVSPSLAATALRHKSLSFDPYVRNLIPKLFGLAPTTVAKMTSHDPTDPKQPGYLPAAAATMQKAMTGDNLRKTNQAVLDEVAGMLNSLAQGGNGALEVENLYLFLRDTLARATLKPLYGVHSPFAKDDGLLEALWTWDATFPSILLTPSFLLTFLPTALLPRNASRALAAREKMHSAFAAYFAAKGYLDPSVAPLIQHTKQLALAHGWKPAELAQVEASVALVSVQNAAVAVFWMLIHILCCPAPSSPSFLSSPPSSSSTTTPTTTTSAAARSPLWGVEAIRQEVSAFVEFSSPASGDGGKVATLHVGEMLMAHYNSSSSSSSSKNGRSNEAQDRGKKAQAAITTGVYSEVLRLYTAFSPTRRTMSDVRLADTYTLYAGADVVVPTSVLHRLPAVWGGSEVAAREFDPLRWSAPSARDGVVDEDGKDAKSRLRAMDEAFVPFGGGKHLCPGRKLAFAEVVGLVAALVIGFDITPAAEDGRLEVPAPGKRALDSGMLKPAGEGKGMRIRIARRKGWEGVRWQFEC